MRICLRLMLLLAFTAALFFGITPTAPTPAQAQVGAPTGVVAFVGSTSQGNADVYLLDIGSGQIGKLNATVNPDSDLAWQPTGSVLAFTTQDGGYGLLSSLKGCFEGDHTCTDIAYVYPPAIVSQIEWSPDGSALFYLTDEGLKSSPPRSASPSSILSLNISCEKGIDIAPTSFFLLCAAKSGSNTRVAIYGPGTAASSPKQVKEIGTFQAITDYDIGPQGQAAVGTLETGNVSSGFYAKTSGSPTRLADFQIHIYALAFSPQGDQVAIAGATSDSTGDGTLSDGDTAELFLYTTANGQITQITGFTGATDVTWAPDGNTLLVITDHHDFMLYSLSTNMVTSLQVTLPQPDLQISAVTWNPSSTIVPAVPTATPTATATPIPTIPPPPTWTPTPTATVIPTVTPGSPMGTGCQYAFPTQPVVVGDTAEVTSLGSGLRLRDSAALTANQIRELSRGARMVILGGPTCSQGYRWWQVRMESDGRTGWVADSEPSGWWIQRAATITATPPLPPESIVFYADRYVIAAGQCVTISWAVEGIKAVYYQGGGVVGHDSRVECPTSTSIYTLSVLRADDSTANYTLTIMVVVPTSTP